MPGLYFKGEEFRMPYITKRVFLPSAVLMVFFIAASPSVAQDLSAHICEVVIYDENTELQDSMLAVDLARSNFAAYKRIFEMIEGLWEGRTIPRMDYIEAKHDLDAARLDLERAGLILDRQDALVEQYRLVCKGAGSDRDAWEQAIRKQYLRYRRSDCDALAKGAEVAATNLEFRREYLTQIHKLREEKFATNTQVVLAELDVEREEKNLADAQRRAAVCNAEIEGLK